jgi:hypothetical protein
MLKTTITSPHLTGFKLDSTNTIVNDGSREQMFKDKILNALTTQLQQCTSPSNREILSTLSDEFGKVALANIPDESTTDSCFGSSGNAVDAFIIGLKQNKLHRLEQELGAYFSQQMESFPARIKLRAVQVEYQLPALEALRESASDSPLLQTCLDEHIARISTARSDFIINSSSLPKIHNMIYTQIQNNERSITGKEIPQQQKENINAHLRSKINERIDSNNIILKKLYTQASVLSNKIGSQVDAYYECRTSVESELEQKNKHLDNIGNKLREGNVSALLYDKTIPESVQKLLLALEQSKIFQADVQTHIGNTEYSLAELNKKIIPETNRDLKLVKDEISVGKKENSTLENIIVSRGVVKDILLKVKRLFGGGKDEESRAELQNIQQELTVDLEKSNKKSLELQRNIKQYEDAVIILENFLRNKKSEIDVLKKNNAIIFNNIIEEIEAKRNDARNECDEKIKAADENKTTERDLIDSIADPIEDDITKITAHNSALRILLSLNDLLKNYPSLALKQAFSGTSVLEEISDKLQECILSTTESLNKTNITLNELESEIRRFRVKPDPSTKDKENIFNLLKVHNIDLSEFNTIETPPGLRLQLLDAANIYAMLSVEKVQFHPLTQHVVAAEAVKLQTLEFLNALEALMNKFELEPENKDKKPAKGRSQEERLASIHQHIQGIRRIIEHEHSEALISKMDFLAQYHHSEKDVYMDRQGEHGTCVLHSWNNLLAHLTDNRHMVMTPWRIEKFGQAMITQSAHQQLRDLLSNPERMTPASVEQTLKQIAGSSGIVHQIDHYLKFGHIMKYEDTGFNIIGYSNLRNITPQIYELANLRSEILSSHFYYKDMPEDTKSRLLDELQTRDFDGIGIGFHGNGGHAMALIKQEANYLLLDSNNDDPLSLTLTQLVDYICSGRSASATLDQELRKRGYNDYSSIFLHYGLYKQENKKR